MLTDSGRRPSNDGITSLVGPDPFRCDLCMATGWSADPCPFHKEYTWAEWLTTAIRERAWTIQRNLTKPLVPSRSRTDT